MLSSWDSLTYVILYTLLMWMPYMLAQFYSNGTAKLLFEGVCTCEHFIHIAHT